jgi:hypothetical protein
MSAPPSAASGETGAAPDELLDDAWWALDGQDLYDALGKRSQMDQAATEVRATIAALRERVEKAEAENADLQVAFDLQWAADQRARELWCAAHPGNDLVWPDRARLVLWLIERAEACERDRDKAIEYAESATNLGFALFTAGRITAPEYHVLKGSARYLAARAPSTPSASTEVSNA